MQNIPVLKIQAGNVATPVYGKIEWEKRNKTLSHFENWRIGYGKKRNQREDIVSERLNFLYEKVKQLN